jgi:serine protease Do
MRQFGITLLAGVLGGLITLAGINWMDMRKTADTQPGSPARLVNMSPTGAGFSPSFDFKEAARIVTPAVVHISTLSSAPVNPMMYFFPGSGGNMPYSEGAGSGVIYSSDGYIITNNHVIESAKEIKVTLADNRVFEARLIGKDPKSDLAVLKIDARDLPTLALANSDMAEIGEWVLAVGNPLELNSTVTAGIISAKGRSLKLLPDRDAIEAFIQTDAAVNPGNSGGALVDAQGRLLGINTAIATRTGTFQGYSFAIPVNLVVRIADDIIQYGSYQRAFLGVEIYSLDANAARELDVDINQGVVVERVVDGGSAQYAGILPKDIIVSVNDRNIRDVPELTEIVGRAKVGDTLQVRVLRDGRELDVSVRMRASK